MTRYLPFLFLLLTFGSTADNAPDQETANEFNEAYRNSVALTKSGDHKAALAPAHRAVVLAEHLELSTKKLATLKFNLGYLLRRNYKYAESVEVLEEALELQQEEYGEGSPQTIMYLQGLADSEAINEPRDALKHYKQAVKIAKGTAGEDSLGYAAALFQMGQAKLIYLRQARSGKRDLQKSLELFVALKGPDSSEAMSALFNLAKYDMALGDYDKAITSLNSILNMLDNPDEPDSRLELTLHSFLVEAYEKNGESDKATRHCLAIGRMTPERQIQDYIPLIKAKPKYPSSAVQLGKEGSVVVEFDVDEQGFVLDPRIVSREGSKVFDEPSLEVALKFRYAPRFVDGKPVLTRGVQNRIVYELAKR